VTSKPARLAPVPSAEDRSIISLSPDSHGPAPGFSLKDSIIPLGTGLM
jgi:hypothetical protein